MRLFPIVTALLVVAGLFLLIFEREAVMEFARGEASDASVQTDSTAQQTADETGAETEQAPKGASVVALKSVAQPIDMPVVLRGRTEANRRVDLRAETSGQVVSAKLAKGTQVAAGDILCKLDAGTREASLAEAKARLAEAKARAPEADARVIEAQARLDEALINQTAAAKLAEGGFASDTRVASTNALVESARASFIAAQSGAASSLASIQSAEAAVAAASREIERLDIRAPFAGILEVDSAETGTLLQPGSACTTVVQYNPIRIVGFVSELQVDLLNPGLEAGVKLASGRPLMGTVTFVADTADPATRTFRVDVEVQANPDAAPDAPNVRAGQTAEVVVNGNSIPAHLLPQSALTLDNDGRLGVRVVEQGADGDVAGFAEVTLVRDSVDGVWVTGLGDTADVITIGHHYVTDGVALNVTYQEPGL